MLISGECEVSASVAAAEADTAVICCHHEGGLLLRMRHKTNIFYSLFLIQTEQDFNRRHNLFEPHGEISVILYICGELDIDFV